MKMLQAHHKKILGGVHARVLRDLLPMEVTPACKWFLAEDKARTWEYSDDFACLVPPAPLTWLEFDTPDRVQGGKRVGQRMGLLAVTYEIAPEMRRSALADDLLLYYMQMLDRRSRSSVEWMGDKSVRLQYILRAAETQRYPRWITCWNLIMAPARGPLLGLGMYGLYLDEQGRCIRGLNSVISSLPQNLMEKLPQDFDYFHGVLPFMFALSLSHCTKVKATDIDVPPALGKRGSQRGLPYSLYRILDINPMRHMVRRGATLSGESEARQAMLFVRSHQRTLGESSLYAKRSGSTWWHLQAQPQAVSEP